MFTLGSITVDALDIEPIIQAFLDYWFLWIGALGVLLAIVYSLPAALGFVRFLFSQFVRGFSGGST